ncbi:MAG TPA: protein kinase [Polyangiaceae bacterium]|nr:protein kinase [Polyangiaceae bacterium]
METVRTKLRLLGRYRLIVELGRGDLGIVYSAVEQGPVGGKAVVVKELRPELAGEPAILHAVLEQAWLSVRLDHPNIVQTFEAGDEGGHYFVAMEYLEGQTLQRAARALRREGRQMPRALHLRLISDMLLGLHYAHELRDADGTLLNVVHRGVCPRNLFLTYDGSIKLVDFGVAKVLEASHQASVSKLESKAAYMAPEQLYDAPSVDRRADVFAAGVMLWEALTGRDFWDGVPGHELLTRLMRDALPPASPASFVPDLPPELDRMCVTALAGRREARFPTALAFREAIEQYIMASGEGASAYEVGRFVAATFVKERPTELSRLGAELARARPISADGGFAITPPVPRSASPLSRSSGHHAAAPISRPSGRLVAAPLARSSGHHPLPPLARPSGQASTPPGQGSTPPGRPSGPPASAAASKRPAARAPSAFSTRGAVLAGAAVILASAALTTGAILATRGVPLRARAAAQATPSSSVRRASASLSAGPQPGESAALGAGPGPGESAAPAGSVLALSVHVSPEHARVFLDGEELPPAARNGVRARDGRPHLVLAEAEGYQPRSQTVFFNSDDVALDIALAKQAPEAAPPASASGRPSRRRGPRPQAAPARQAPDP